MQQLCSSYAFHNQPEQAGGEGATVEGALEKSLFFPPLWNQRFSSVANILEHYQVQRVLDLGCGEGKLAAYLKHNQLVEHLRGVDIDAGALRLAASLSLPLVGDYLFPRSAPFSLSFYRGDVLSPHPSLLSFDAVVCIEVMEHLEQGQLGRLEEVVFGHVQPKLAIFSTPNFEFNQLFASPLPHRFRHFDHKFEFTRSQFEEWGRGVGKRFGYCVEFCGVGDPPPHHPSVGHCSQLAIFLNPTHSPPPNGAHRIAPNDRPNSNHAIDIANGEYEMIAEIEYPVKKEITKEQVEWEVEQYYRKHCVAFDWPLNQPVKIEDLLAYESDLLHQCFGGDVEKLAHALSASSLFSLSPDRTSVAGSPSYYLLSLRSGHDHSDFDDFDDGGDGEGGGDGGDGERAAHS